MSVYEPDTTFNKSVVFAFVTALAMAALTALSALRSGMYDGFTLVAGMLACFTILIYLTVRTHIRDSREWSQVSDELRLFPRSPRT